MKNEQQHGKNRNTRKETNNTKINKERKKERKKKHTMRITAAEREPIACRPKIDSKGGIGSSS
jgi:hypothetical protein